jgi:hypothetical protein
MRNADFGIWGQKAEYRSQNSEGERALEPLVPLFFFYKLSWC